MMSSGEQMDSESSLCEKSDKPLPVLYIQCDWDEVLRMVKARVWVIAKSRGCANIEGKIHTASLDSTNSPILKSLDGFTANIIARNILQVKHDKSEAKISFLAATKVYSDIHKKAIRSLAVTTTGFGASYCDENNLLVWDFNKGQLKRKLEGHIGEVYKCRFFPSQKVVLSCGADMQLKIWCIETGFCVSLKGHKRAVTDFAMVDAGKNIISVSKDGSAKLWNCGDATCLATLANASSDINCCAITTVPDTYHVGQSEDTPLNEHEIGTKNKLLVFGCEDGTIHGIIVRSRRKVFVKSLDAPVNTLSFLPDQDATGNRYKFVVGCQNGKILLYDVNSVDEPLKTLHDSNNAILRIISYENSGFLVSESDGSVYYVTSSLDSKIFSLTGPCFDPIYDMSSDGRFVYTACRDSIIRRYLLEKAIKDVQDSEDTV